MRIDLMASGKQRQRVGTCRANEVRADHYGQSGSMSDSLRKAFANWTEHICI